VPMHCSGNRFIDAMRRRMLPAPWDNVAFNLPVDGVSDPVETNLGVEIIKVWEKQPESVRPFDEVKDTIRNSLIARKRNEKRRDVLRDLKSGAKVEQLIAFEAPQPTRPPMGHPGMGEGQGPAGHPHPGMPGAPSMGDEAPAPAGQPPVDAPQGEPEPTEEAPAK